MTARRIAGGLLVASVLAVAAGAASCAKKPSIDLTLVDSCGLKGDSTCDPKSASKPTECGTYCTKTAEWAELAVFSGGCPADAQLAAGDTSGAVQDYTAALADALPSPGDLSKDNYGFAALLRNADCAVVGYGCTPADLSHVRSVTVEIYPSPEQGACAAPLSCVAGRCDQPVDAGAGDAKPGDAGDSGDAGGGCALALVASGKLPAPIGAGASETGPGIVATSTGFVIGYREDDAPGTEVRVDLYFVKDDGTVPSGDGGADGVHVNVPGCPGVVPSTGMAMTMNATEGLAIVAQPDCDAGSTAGAGATFITFGPSGGLSNIGTALGAGPDLSIAPVHGATRDSTGTAFTGTYTTSGVAYALGIVETQPTSAFAPLFPGTTNSYGQIASTSDVYARLADSLDGGSATTIFGVGGWDASAPKVSSHPGAGPAALTAWGSNALAVIPAGDGGLGWEAIAANGAPLGTGTLPGGPYLAVDTVALGDHVFFAGGAAGKISLVRLDGASTKLASQTSLTVPLGPTIGSVPLANFDGKHLALAAIRDRVALAWLTKRKPGATDPTGGWALFSCAK